MPSGSSRPAAATHRISDKRYDMRIDKKELLQLRKATNKVITGKAGLLEGSRLVCASLRRVNSAIEFPDSALNALIASLPPDFPTGDSLLYINDAALLAAIRELSVHEGKYRSAVILECRVIYGKCRELLDET